VTVGYRSSRLRRPPSLSTYLHASHGGRCHAKIFTDDSRCRGRAACPALG